MKARIIGLCGTFGAGKDEVARVLSSLGKDYFRQAFGDRLKKEVTDHLENTNRAALPYNVEILRLVEEIRSYEDTNAFAKPTTERMRRLLQWWGTEFRRNADPDYWVKALDRWHAATGRIRLVVPDVRFENEVKWVRDNGGVVWVVRRDRRAYDYESNLIAHPSEQLALSPDEYFDDVIGNYGTLDDLQAKVERKLNGEHVAAAA